MLSCATSSTLAPCYGRPAGRNPRRSDAAALHSRISTRNPLKARAGNSKDLQLVTSEEQEDGSVIFVFGTEDEAAAARKQADVDTIAPPQPAPGRAEEPPHVASQAKEEHKEELDEPPLGEASSKAEPGPLLQSEQQTTVAEPVAHVAHAEPTTDAVSDEPEGDDDEAHASSAVLPDLDAIADFSSLKVSELKELCRRNNIRGFSKLAKADLIQLLESQSKSAL